jgi:hypothetical protein
MVVGEGDDQERCVFQVREDAAAVVNVDLIYGHMEGHARLIAINVPDYFGDGFEPNPFHLPIETGHLYSWLDRAGFDLIMSPPADEEPCFSTIWDGMVLDFVEYPVLKKPRPKSGELEQGAQPEATKQRRLVDPRDVQQHKQPPGSRQGAGTNATTKKAAILFTEKVACGFPAGKYPDTGEFMFHVPVRNLRGNVTASKMAQSGDASYDELTEALKTNTDTVNKKEEYRHTGQKTSLYAIGMRASLLDVISAADPNIVLAGTIAELLTTAIDHTAIPVDTYLLAQLCRSWIVPDGCDGIRFLHGALLCIWPF